MLPAETIDEWKCPICFDLLHKPCVNVCGHVFCFWCMHQAMNPYRPSQCPVCRSVYSRFPKVCEILHSFLLSNFPEDYNRREDETKADESNWGFSSPDLDSASLGAGQGNQDTSTSLESEQTWSESSFTCVNPNCHNLLYEPCVLSCGHAVCQPTCVPRPPLSEAEGSTSTNGSPSNTASSNIYGSCPLCNTAIVPNPRVCMKLADFLQRRFPEKYAERAAAVQLVKLSRTPGASAPIPPPPDPKELKGAMLEALRRRSGGNHSALLAGVREELQRSADSTYTWYMVGCDDCGVYPIIGRRYKCQHCPESIGYDLCGECYDRGQAGRGRFNQNHLTDHVMDKVEPDLNWVSPSDPHQLLSWVNMLELLHPELSVEQIMSLAYMQMAGSMASGPPPPRSSSSSQRDGDGGSGGGGQGEGSENGGASSSDPGASAGGDSPRAHACTMQ